MLPTLTAERQLKAIEAASVPYMSKDGHRDTMRKYRRMLGGEARAEKATVGQLGAAGIQVEYVNADGTPSGDGTRQDETGASSG